MNYSQGKIYKIVDNTTDNIYIGSSCQNQLRKRLQQHVSDYKRYIEGKKGNCTSFDIIKNGNYDIILIEEYPCMNKMQLHKRESYKNWRNNNIEHIKQYRKDNRERKQMLENKRRKFKRDCDYLCCIDISIFQ